MSGSTIAPKEELWSIRKVLSWTQAHFEKHEIDSPRLTSEVLLSHVLKCDRVRLYVELDRPLEKQELAAFRQFIARRVQGEPTQYLTGEKEFYGRRFKVDARVLIPRPETELLVESVLQQVPQDTPSRILDVCTGSGCIAVTIAAERPLASVWAVDLSPDACAAAKMNAENLGVASRVTVWESDWLATLPEDSLFDVIVSNPPYVKTAQIEQLSKEVRQEPILALDGGPDGLECYRKLLPQAWKHLKSGAFLALEIGEDLGSQVLELLRTTGYTSERIDKDLARLDRFAFGTRT